MPSVITNVDCEGACCCRCEACKGVGYWSKYKIKIPLSDSNPTSFDARLGISWGTDEFEVSQLTTCGGLTQGEPIYGSSGGDGQCCWYGILRNDEIEFEYRATIQLATDGTATINWYYSEDLGNCLGNIGTITFQYSSTISNFDCNTGGNSGSITNLTSGISEPCSPDFTSGQIFIVTPSATATWRQCGQNSDGTTHTASSGAFSNAFSDAFDNGV